MSVYDKYELVVGLEVHAQLLTKSKAYSGDANTFGASPNTHLSPVTLGLPGTLPRMNKQSLELAVKMGLATNCSIRPYNEFSRKNYFYADLPKGYQITQFNTPICHDGYLMLNVNGETKKVEIERIHLEEDAGKSIHDLDPYFTLIDLNRAGVPLIEIVSRPDMRSGDEAYAYVSEIRKLVRHLDICDGNMEEGSLRCDANISVRLKGETALGAKVEVKNMNSIRNVKRAIDHEFHRQIDLIEKGEKIHQDTRSFDASNGTTFSMRSKEMAHDYRYFPEPDLQPMLITDEYVQQVKNAMPALPQELKARYIAENGLSDYDAALLTEDKHISAYYEALVEQSKDAKAAANWILGPVKSYLNENAVEITEFPLSAGKIAELITLIRDGKTNFSVASNKLFPALIASPEAKALQLAESMNLVMSSDSGLIESIVDEVLAAFPDKVEEFRSGKKGLMGLFVGEVMKRSGGKADPKITNQILNTKLN